MEVVVSGDISLFYVLGLIILDAADDCYGTRQAGGVCSNHKSCFSKRDFR